jgi:hypothetical protein
MDLLSGKRNFTDSARELLLPANRCQSTLSAYIGTKIRSRPEVQKQKICA